MTADIDVELDAGSFLMQNVTVAGNVEIEGDAGAIKLENVNGVKASLHTDVGSIKTKNCSFDAFNSESDVGSIDLEKLENIYRRQRKFFELKSSSVFQNILVKISRHILSGKDDIMNWEPSDLFQFCYDTKPIKGSLEEEIGRASCRERV